MAEISRGQLEAAVTSATATISDVKHLSSYNWIEAPTPTIVVPGAPARWTAPEGTRQVAKDSGLIYRAQNAARHPESPLEPLLRSLYAENDAFNIRSADIITDRNNVRKLLSFVSPESDQNKLEAFAIKVEIVQGTAILCRDEAETQYVIGPHEFHGFGHEFEKAYTVHQVRGSTGHHRVISYQFCGLTFIVRHETDAYVDDSHMASPRKAAGDNDLSRMMQDLALSSNDGAEYIKTAGSKLRIKRGGQTVSLSSTLEIKTRTIKKPLDLNAVAPQLWVSQTPNLVRAYHDRGRFSKPQVENVAAQIEQWEVGHQSSLRKLGWLMKRITALAEECGGRATVKYNADEDKLVVLRDEGWKLLPEDLYAKWTAEAACAEPRPVDTAQGATLLKKAETKSTEMSDDVSLKEPAVGSSALPFADVVQLCLDKGFRQAFRHLPPKLSDYITLCASLQRLGIDVLRGQHIRELMADMRRGKDDYDPEERQQIGGLKSVARDAAFKLVYIILQGEVRVSDVNMAYNAVLFVVSHRRIFRYRTRKMVREAFLRRLTASQKQLRELDRWPVKQEGHEGSEDEGKTTSEEEYFVDSDWSI